MNNFSLTLRPQRKKFPLRTFYLINFFLVSESEFSGFSECVLCLKIIFTSTFYKF